MTTTTKPRKAGLLVHPEGALVGKHYGRVVRRNV
jgi:hypothetical protein